MFICIKQQDVTQKIIFSKVPQKIKENQTMEFQSPEGLSFIRTKR
jgi:hypothetical protein